MALGAINLLDYLRPQVVLVMRMILNILLINATYLALALL
jgi:hypothetical protein